jgi:beta-lactamase superfamily II metal-dependent hydrolase
MFTIEMLPAQYGDCLLVTYGPEDRPRRLLIDGGTPATFKHLKQRIEALPRQQRHFELLIVTHIDDDHIGGVLPLLREKGLGVTFGDIWFNGWTHLVPPDFMGPRQGDELGNLLSQRVDLPWNKAFKEKTVVVPRTGPLPVHALAGGMKLTLLSPRRKELEALNTDWIDKSMKAGRIPGEPQEVTDLLGRPSRLAQLASEKVSADQAVANGSSIAVLAEYDGKRALLTGDAFAPVLIESIRRLPDFHQKLAVQAFKLPHHGSEANLSPELLQALSCPRYLISTSGARFEHPDESAIARILQYGGEKVELCFNYKSDTTRPWESRRLAKDLAVRQLDTRYPEAEDGGLLVEL